MKIWTTKDLLYQILEFIALTPDSNQWNEISLKYNRPRLIRFKRLSALLKAFELIQAKEQKSNIRTFLSGKKKTTESELTEDEINAFLHGDFIPKRNLTNYPKIQNLIEKEKLIESDSFTLKDVYSLYRHLMNYRIEIDSVLQYNSGVFEANSLGFRSAISITAELNNNLRKKTEEIDELLFEIINPKGLSFEEDTLIKKYGFPNENLDAIDMENY